MAKDLQDSLATVLGTVAQEASKNLISSRNNRSSNSSGGGPLSGTKGVLAGAGAAAAAPLAMKGARKLMTGANGLGNIAEAPGKLAEAPGKLAEAPGKLASNLGDRAASTLKDNVKGQVDEAGGPGGLLKDAAKSALPFGGGKGKGGTPGVGKGRRMPVQQSVDIGLPIETVYNQWTQFAEWPNFMHRVTRATQEDDCTVSFETKIWTRKREFTANIETQRPNERIKWSVSQGLNHIGVATFHELGPNLTRVLVGFDVEPGGMIEKFARGARHIKRAARADLHRFKAFIETQETETGAWRGRIEEGELVEEHDPSYDEGREYSEAGQKGDQSKKRESGGSGRGRRSSARGGQTGSRGRSASSGSSRQASRGGSSGGSSRSGSSRSGSSRSSSSRSGSSRSGSSRSGSSPSGSSRSGSSRASASGSGRKRARSGSRSSSQRSRANGRG